MSLDYRGGDSNEGTKAMSSLAGGILFIGVARSLRAGGGMGGLVMLCIIGYVVYAYILTPLAIAMNHLGQSFGKTIYFGVSYAAIPGFMVLVFVGMVASLSVRLVSPFNKYPNYASRAILGLSIGLIVISWVYRVTAFEALGPIMMGFYDQYPLIIMTLLYGILSWVYFSVSRYAKFKSIDLCEQGGDKKLDQGEVESKKIAFIGFQNRRIMFGFLCSLLLLAMCDAYLWPILSIETRFLTEFIPRYIPQPQDYSTYIDVTTNVILHTVATYLFVAYFVFTLLLRSAFRMHRKGGYGGYVPPYYAYGLAIIGAFCCAVFGFVPYPYMGEENATLQAIAPIVYFSVSLLRTAWAYYSFLSFIDSNIYQLILERNVHETRLDVMARIGEHANFVFFRQIEDQHPFVASRKKQKFEYRANNLRQQRRAAQMNKS
jgi:MFS family permease